MLSDASFCPKEISNFLFFSDLASHRSVGKVDRLGTSNTSTKFLEDNDRSYIEQFFVGLLEGDGSITTNLDSKRKSTVIVRIVISLKNLDGNVEMLLKIQQIVGGRVVTERKDQYVT
jgi:hypothetical protein